MSAVGPRGSHDYQRTDDLEGVESVLATLNAAEMKALLCTACIDMMAGVSLVVVEIVEPQRLQLLHVGVVLQSTLKLTSWELCPIKASHWSVLCYSFCSDI